MNTENSKTNEPHKFVLNLSQRLDLRTSDKHVAPKTFIKSVYYTRKNIRKQYKNNKLKVIVLTWNDEFELPDGSYSVTNNQEYIEHIIKKHEALTAIPAINVYINRINNRLVFKMMDVKVDNRKDGYKLELQTPKTMKLFGSTKKFIGKTKIGEKTPSLEVVEVVLAQCNLVDNQYEKYKVLYTFTPNKSYAYLLNVETINLVFLKTYIWWRHNITFSDQNGRPLEIKNKVNLTLFINK